MTRYYEPTPVVKYLLSDAFPGLNFDVELCNPEYQDTNLNRMICVTYDGELAQEQRVTQTDMQQALMPVITQESVQYGTKTYGTHWLSSINFARK